MNTRWHHDDLTVNGMPYWTRHPVPTSLGTGDATATALMDLPEQQMLSSVAAHELGHALIWLAGGLRISHASISPAGADGGHAKALPTGTPDEARVRVIGVAAGERAQDRWLREAGLWTPGRAAMVELSACNDRAYVLEHTTPRPVFGAGEEGLDYLVLHELADAELDRIWDQLTSVLPLLLEHQVLTGEQLAAHTGLPNPAPLPGTQQ